MTSVPETRYAKSGGVHIAYQVVGDGSIDVVFVPGAWGHLEHRWAEPGYAKLFRRIASFARLIVFDRRGTGLSDRGDEVPSLEVQIEDVLAVMDATGSKRAAVWGQFDGGAMATLFAAIHPDRTLALVTYAAFAKALPDADYPWGISIDPAAVLAIPEEDWGKPGLLQFIAPSRLDDERFKEWWARNQRLGASPAGAAALIRMISEIDIRTILSTIRVPTLVLQCAGDLVVPPGNGRYLSDNISGARYVELPDGEYFIGSGHVDTIADEIAEFLTGIRPRAEPDRRLATILCGAIVEPAKRAAALGDRRWRALLDEHDTSVQRHVEQFGGAVRRATEDGFLATFDGPARAIKCASAIVDAAAEMDLQIRAGLHAGEVETRGGDMTGLALHVAGLVAALSRPGEVLVSRTVVDLVAGSGLAFAERGTHALDGVPEDWRLYAVISEAGEFQTAWKEGRGTRIADAAAFALHTPAEPAADPALPLTAREREVAVLLAAGLTNRQIADRLVISERTAEAHVANILRKLDAGTRAEAAARLARRGSAL